MSLKMRKGPVMLVILDGWGHREAGDGNAIAMADTLLQVENRRECYRIAARPRDRGPAIDRGAAASTGAQRGRRAQSWSSRVPKILSPASPRPGMM